MEKDIFIEKVFELSSLPKGQYLVVISLKKYSPELNKYLIADNKMIWRIIGFSHPILGINGDRPHSSDIKDNKWHLVVTPVYPKLTNQKPTEGAIKYSSILPEHILGSFKKN